MQHTNELVLSVLTIVLAILAIGIFIYRGANIAFYITVIIAMAVGFINAWLISKTGTAVSASAKKTTKTSATKRRRGA